jgi:hypothetical protein
VALAEAATFVRNKAKGENTNFTKSKAQSRKAFALNTIYAN